MATLLDEALILAQVAGLLQAIAGAETNLRVLQLGDEPGDDQATKVTLRMASLRVQRAQRRSTGSEASTADVTIVLELMSPEAQGSQYAAWSAAAHVLALVDGYAVKDASTGQTLHVGAVDSASDAELGQTGAAAMQRVTITVQATAERFSGTDLQTNFS
jgi:hypothetical protein